MQKVSHPQRLPQGFVGIGVNKTLPAALGRRLAARLAGQHPFPDGKGHQHDRPGRNPEVLRAGRQVEVPHHRKLVPQAVQVDDHPVPQHADLPGILKPFRQNPETVAAVLGPEGVGGAAALIPDDDVGRLQQTLHHALCAAAPSEASQRSQHSASSLPELFILTIPFSLPKTCGRTRHGRRQTCIFGANIVYSNCDKM